VIACAVTHLVVEPRHQLGTGHLVPVDLVDARATEISLRCTIAEFEAFEDAEETRFLPGAGGMESIGLGVIGMPAGPQPVIYDRVPPGEIEVRRGEPVHATDGAIGRVQGLIVDPGDHHVTHVLLDEGHLWGKKRVAIPISAVASVDDGVRLKITKDDVRDLPPVDVDHEQ